MADSLKKKIEDIARKMIQNLSIPEIDLSNTGKDKIVGFLPKGRYKGKTGSIVISLGKSRRIVTVYNPKKS